MKQSNAICLGTVKLGMPEYGFSSAHSSMESQAITFLKQTEACGISRFDTSPRYGESEKILGEYIAQTETKPFVSSKIDNLRPDSPDTPKKMLGSVKLSLEKLNLTQLDVCYLHQNDLDIISDSYVREGFILLKQKGLIKYSGASLYGHEECEYALSSGGFDFIQVPVSIFDVSFYNAFIKENKTSVRFVARSLLLQGILVNRNAINFRIRQSQQILRYLNQLDQLAQECNLSTLELALAFVFSLRNIDHYLIGTTSIENLEKDIQCLKVKLPPQAFMRVLETASQPESWANPRNWR